MYKVNLAKRTIKQIDKIPEENYLRIYNKMKSFENNPRPSGCVKLTDFDGYRIRVGNYRILYEVNDADKIIEIYSIVHQKNAYK